MAKVLEDPKLQYAMPMENEIRIRYPFANLHFSFPTKPYAGNSVMFPAYLKKITDNIKPEYNPVRVFGRTDPIPTYKFTSRKMSVDFDIPAFSEFDANEILKKFNILMRNMYPGFLETKGGQYIINSPPLIRIQFANLIVNPLNGNSGLLGYVSDFNISHDFNTHGVFVVPENNESENQQGFLFAKAYSLTFNFDVLHESIVGWDDATGKFIGEKDYGYNVVKPEQIAISQKLGSSVLSNLRGATTSTPATVSGVTRIFDNL
jgi:hypothetical protein